MERLWGGYEAVRGLGRLYEEAMKGYGETMWRLWEGNIRILA